MTPFRLTSCSYLFILFDKLQDYNKRRSIFKLTLKATVAVINILKTGILIILVSIFHDIQKLRSVYN